MRRLLYLAAPSAVAILVLASATMVRSETWSLELKRLDAKNRCPGAMRTLSFAIGDKRPSRMQMPGVEEQGEQQAAAFKRIVTKEPTYESKSPLRSVVKLGSREYAFALDIVSPKAPDTALAKLSAKLLEELTPPTGKPTYNRLYFDINCNGDLTDDRVLAAESAARMIIPGSRFQFPQIDVALDIDGTKLDYSFIVSGSAMFASGGSSYTTVSFISASSREGDITLGGKKHHVVLLDFNCNGRFDDQIKMPQAKRWPPGPPGPEPGDVLLVDALTRNVNRSSLVTAGNSNQLLVSKLVSLDGRFYDMQVSPGGDQLKLSPTEQLGHFSNPPDGFHGMIYGDKGLLRINGSKDGPMSVPEGQWKLLSYEIDQTGYRKPESPTEKKQKEEEPVMRKLPMAGGGKQGKRTVISARVTGESKPFVVRADETQAMPFGPPFTPKVTAGAMGPDGESLPLALAFIGRGGEQCNNLMVDGQRPPKPQFTITDPDGKVVQKGSFEYG